MMKKLAEAGPIVGMVFGLAVKGKQTLPWLLSAVIDKVLFSRVKQATGGRLRAAVCGGKSAGPHNGPPADCIRR
jgi:long-chain acyl-CoA synthetase